MSESEMSKSDRRDTQFLGFAKRIWDTMPDVPENLHDVRVYDAWSDECEQIIACYAYDLVKHTVGYCLEYLHECGFEISGSMNGRIQPSIPDPTTLPDESW